MSSGAFDSGQQRRAEPAISLGKAADQPRSPTLVLAYPHLRPSLEPKRLRREEIWAVAEKARQQLCRGHKLKIDIVEIAKRASRLTVNGVAFEVCWELDQPVADDRGQPVFGALEHDPAQPRRVTIALNGRFIGDRRDLARSTAAHELGHAIFETPAWMQNEAIVASTPSRRYRLTDTTQESRAGAEMDWVEWRANEFMGAFLVPRGLLHRHMHKRAAALGIPLIDGRDSRELPVVCPQAPSPLIDELVGELADMFGLSELFLRVRLRRYGLVPERLLG